MRVGNMHIDVPTGSLDPAKVTDYAAEYVGAALYPPLIRAGVGGILPGLISGIEPASEGGLLFRLAEAKWSDGLPFVAEDVRQSWMRVEAARGTGAALLRLLFGSESIASAVRILDSGTLAVQLRPGGRAFLSCLGAMSLSPVRPEDVGGITLGPFRLLDAGSETQGPRLARNESVSRIANAVEEIAFEIVRDPDESLDAWLAGRCDVTCTTHFPSARVDQPGVAEYLQHGGTMLRGAVYLAPEWSDRTGISVRELSALVPHEDIARELNGCVTPEAGFWPGDPCGPPHRHGGIAERPEIRAVLRLAVADFHPNLEVCRRLSRGWGDAGVDVEIEVIDYTDLASARETHDAVYQIFGPSFPHQAAHLLSLDLGSSGASADVQRARYATVTGVASSEDAQLLSSHLHRHPPYVPVLTVQSRAAVTPDLVGFAIDEQGRPDFSAFTWRPAAPGASLRLGS